MSFDIYILALPSLMDTRDLKMTTSKYFSLSTHAKKLLLVTFHDSTAEIGVSFLNTWKKKDGTLSDGQIDVTVEIEMAGADPARVQRVHLHPLGFSNGCNAPVLKQTKGLRDFKIA